MKKMKVLTLMVLYLALAVVIAACGTETTGSNQPPEPENTSKPANNPSTEETGEDEPVQTQDLGGRTIKIAAWWDETPQPVDDTGKALIENQKAIEQKYNVKFEYVNVPFGDYFQQFTTTTMAGQPFADIVRLQYDWQLTSIPKGQIMKLSDYMDIAEYPHLEKGYPILGEDYSFGVKWGISDGGIVYNREIFKRLGLTDPQDLVDQGKWNWEEFSKLAKQATQDSNNDGKPDTWGWSGWNMETAQFLIVSNGGTVADDDAGKEMLTDSKTIEALDFLNKMYNVDKVVKVAKGDVDNWEERVTFGDGDVAMTYSWTWINGDYKKKNIDYGFVPFPMGPQGTDYSAPVSGGHAWVIPTGVKDPDVVAKIYAELRNIPSKEDYIGQDLLEQYYSTEKDIEMILSMSGKEKFMNYGAYPDYPFGKMVSDVVKNQVPAATAAEKVKQEAQAAIDKVLKANSK
ncbi:ABC transporter substrate-binding protein [Paenibacillus spongiae]|uniref:Extracellular solute-binding protein n=1 Tax=Paenibacillus spongiae TaxID=2909671 RepID=A0ABY5SEA8_9BACL|nr:extracellular solute-binding protein [Paenibacillus spongiae]UVI31979.1 extracellular solute-binding protein [Paenibacillus spongiae]